MTKTPGVRRRSGRTSAGHSTGCYTGGVSLLEISQRDLRLRSKDIMDAVERGQAFTVTRDGRPMGQLVPLRRQWVTREQFAVSSRLAPRVDPDRLRADSESVIDGELCDPYGR